LVNRAREGEERRPMGLHAGKIIVKDDFFPPLPKEFWGVFE